MDMKALDTVLRARRAQRSLPLPGERRRIRESRGLTRKDVARILQTAPGSVYAWERPDGTSPRGELALFYELLLKTLATEAEPPVAAA